MGCVGAREIEERVTSSNRKCFPEIVSEKGYLKRSLIGGVVITKFIISFRSNFDYYIFNYYI